MTNLLPAGFYNDPARINSEAKDGMDAITEFIRESVGGSVETILTIVSGAIAPTTGIHALNTEFSATTDDLTNISTVKIPDGRMLLIRPADNSRVVTVKHAAGGAGSITLTHNVDFVMNSTKKWLMLKRTGTTWEEVFRSWGQDYAGIRAQLSMGSAALYNVGTTESTIPLLGPGGALPAVGGQNLTGLNFVPLGVALPYFGVVLPTGWVWARGYTIGRAGSGGSERANDDCWPLFNHLWWHMADAQAPVSGGRSSDPSYDFFTRYCTIRVPDCRGKTLVGMDNMGFGLGAGYIGNAIAGTVLGAIGGEEVHYLLWYEIGVRDHGHPCNDAQHFHYLTDTGHYHYQEPHGHNGGDYGHQHVAVSAPNTQGWGYSIGSQGYWVGTDQGERPYNVLTTVNSSAVWVDNQYANLGAGYLGSYANYSYANYTVYNSGNANASNWHTNLQPSIICSFMMRL